MTITYFLAFALGWYLVITGLLLLLRRDVVIAATSNLMEQPGQLLIIAFITIILGLLMVISHNIWVMHWPVVITRLAWTIYISGLIRLFCPELVHKMWSKMVAKPGVFTISGIIVLIIGLFLLFMAYFK